MFEVKYAERDNFNLFLGVLLSQMVFFYVKYRSGDIECLIFEDIASTDEWMSEGEDDS